MTIAKLIHNPSAGDEEHSKEKLIAQIEAYGFQCRYSSTKKKGWDEIEDNVDLIVVAGGDGTVRKVVKVMLQRHILDKGIPLAVLPLGTANNVSKSLGIEGSSWEIISAWKDAKRKYIDIGSLFHVDDAQFFLESFGYGIFPYLMQVMKKKEESYDTPEDELKGALKKLHDIIVDYEPRQCQLQIDGIDHSGKYMMAEVMNTKSIGPNLNLSPFGDPGDGILEVVLIPESQKEKFADFIQHLINNGKDAYHFTSIRGKNITISWQGTHIHVDDEIIKLKEGAEVSIQVKKGVLTFLVPA